MTIEMPHMRQEYKNEEQLNYKVKFKKGLLHLEEADAFRILQKQ